MHQAAVRRNPSRKGQSLVEAAFVIAVFLFALIGVVDFSQIMFTHVAMTERLRDALRRGITKPYNATSYQNLVIYGNTAGTGTAFMNLTPANVDVAETGSNYNRRVTIRIINYDMPLFSPFIAGVITSQRSFSATLMAED